MSTEVLRSSISGVGDPSYFNIVIDEEGNMKGVVLYNIAARQAQSKLWGSTKKQPNEDDDFFPILLWLRNNEAFDFDFRSKQELDAHLAKSGLIMREGFASDLSTRFDESREELVAMYGPEALKDDDELRHEAR